ncbi:MAG: succinate dehydrogenase, cytochrome b556 subunit [Rhodospirillaceae bacterium]|jgi:succinate dehydrogenase / fumarate reductase cytochrome b subunit|nr:succinate dehydrogenase, cytochrome b556 subunit [Rhodospirillaceae bacterium]MBT6285479.1 succinate dehydrogenase, cytochrome b556 subunit [Rhodospirillaceae bacterium]
MASNNRPLSPHLQVYKPQLTTFMSITHRATGIALAVGTLMLVCWLIAAATGETAFNEVQAFLGSIVGRLLLLGWSFALFYHLCNGLRHLFWDAGKGFEIETAYMTGRIVIAASILLTIGAWLWGYAAMGVI